MRLMYQSLITDRGRWCPQHRRQATSNPQCNHGSSEGERVSFNIRGSSDGRCRRNPMTGVPGFRVRYDWPRPAAGLLKKFDHAASPQVADSMSRLGGMDSGIRPIWNSPRFIGSALTVWCHAGDNLMIHKALTL